MLDHQHDREASRSTPEQNALENQNETGEWTALEGEERMLMLAEVHCSGQTVTL